MAFIADAFHLEASPGLPALVDEYAGVYQLAFGRGPENVQPHLVRNVEDLEARVDALAPQTIADVVALIRFARIQIDDAQNPGDDWPIPVLDRAIEALQSGALVSGCG